MKKNAPWTALDSGVPKGNSQLPNYIRSVTSCIKPTARSFPE